MATRIKTAGQASTVISGTEDAANKALTALPPDCHSDRPGAAQLAVIDRLLDEAALLEGAFCFADRLQEGAADPEGAWHMTGRSLRTLFDSLTVLAGEPCEGERDLHRVASKCFDHAALVQGINALVDRWRIDELIDDRDADQLGRLLRLSWVNLYALGVECSQRTSSATSTASQAPLVSVLTVKGGDHA